MITVTNILTGEQRNLPNSVSTAGPLFLGPPYSPGSYDILNGSANALTVVFDSMFHVTIPAGSRWNVSNNENLYSWKPVGVDYAAWTTSGLARGVAGWAPVARV
jgi:hypothetical protein